MSIDAPAVVYVRQWQPLYVPVSLTLSHIGAKYCHYRIAGAFRFPARLLVVRRNCKLFCTGDGADCVKKLPYELFWTVCQEMKKNFIRNCLGVHKKWYNVDGIPTRHQSFLELMWRFSFTSGSFYISHCASCLIRHHRLHSRMLWWLLFYLPLILLWNFNDVAEALAPNLSGGGLCCWV